MRTPEEIAELIAMDINSGRALRYAPAKIIESVLRELKPALLEAQKERDLEKNRRIYYQDIVYNLLNAFDKWNGRSVRKGTSYLSGSFEIPSTDWKIAIAEAEEKTTQLSTILKEVVEDLKSIKMTVECYSVDNDGNELPWHKRCNLAITKIQAVLKGI